MTSVTPVKIVEASPRWRDDFNAIAAELRKSLGPLALRIDHIGSTSVPGLDAKDMIDVQVTVEALDFGRLAPRYALLFRDYLRTHPPMAAAYAELKRRLAALGIERLAYADVKDPACDLIMAAAEDWAIQTNRSPGPSDG